MPKRNRIRARARRPEGAAPPRVEREEREQRPERSRSRYRGAPLPVGGSHAIGAPSPTLERAATLERAYVVKDFGRLAKVIAAMLALLAASGFAVSNLVK